VPATEGLHYFARWITPTINPKRFDTRFSSVRRAAGAGRHRRRHRDGRPRVAHAGDGARGRIARGRIQLIPPTVATLDDLSRFASIDEVLEMPAVACRVLALSGDRDRDGVPTMTYPDTTARADPGGRSVLRDGPVAARHRRYFVSAGEDAVHSGGGGDATSARQRSMNFSHCRIGAVLAHGFEDG
jgi:hypothetical protein